MNGITHALAWCCAAIAIMQGYAAFGQGEPQTGPCLAALIQVAGCCLFAQVVWSRIPQVLAFPRRELIAAGCVVAALVTIMATWGAGPQPEAHAWRWAIASLSLFGLALGSLQSFLLFVTIYAAILLVALSLRPSGIAALAFCVTTVLLLSALAHEERLERFPATTTDRGFPRSATRRALRAAAVLFVLFLGFYATKPPAEAVTAEEWIRWLRDTPVDPRALGGGTVDQLQELQEDPFARGSSGETISAGFEADLKFGDMAGGGNEIAFLVQVRGVEGQWFDPRMLRPFWKAAVVSDYDGERWTADRTTVREVSATDGWSELRPRAPAGPLIEQRFVVSSFGDRTLFAIYPLERVELADVVVDREGVARRSRQHRGRFRYRAVSRLVQANPADLRDQAATHPDPRYTEVPERLLRHSTFQAFAGRLTGPRATDKIRAALNALRGFDYSLSPGFDDYEDPTLAFLRLRRGYCQHFASAMALALRATGIPARLAIGFSGGSWHSDRNGSDGGHYAVRRRDAHAWVEVHFERSGWVPFDPAAGPASSFGSTPEPAQTVAPLPETIVELDDPPEPEPEPEPSPTPTETATPEPEPEPSPTTKPATPTPVETPSRTPRPSPTRSPFDDTPRPSPSATPRRPTASPSPSPRPTARPRASATPSTVSDRDQTPQPSLFDRAWDRVGAPTGGADGPAPGSSPGGGGGGGGGDPGVQGGQAQPLFGPGRPAPRSPVGGSVRYLVGTVVREVLFAGGALALLAVTVWVYRQRREDEEVEPEPVDELLELEGEVAARSAPPAWTQAGTSEYEVVELYQRMLAELAKRGLPRHHAQTPHEFARGQAGRLEGVRHLSNLFVRARYGPGAISEADTAKARHLFEVVRGGLRG